MDKLHSLIAATNELQQFCEKKDLRKFVENSENISVKKIEKNANAENPAMYICETNVTLVIKCSIKSSRKTYQLPKLASFHLCSSVFQNNTYNLNNTTVSNRSNLSQSIATP